MSLTTEDLHQIKGVVDESIKGLPTKTDLASGIAELAAMTKHGFDDMSEQFAGVHKELRVIKLDVLDVKLKLADTVQRGEFLGLQTRVENLERKAA